MPPGNEAGPALLRAAAEPKTIFSLQKRRRLHTTIRAFVQVIGPSFVVGFASSTATSAAVWSVILWVRL
jgi:hypothetical protein